MSASPIAAGDLVMVTKACCDSFVRSPAFEVSRLLRDSDPYCCSSCGAVLACPVWAVDEAGRLAWMYPLHWLKKIEPLRAEEERKEEATHGI